MATKYHRMTVNFSESEWKTFNTYKKLNRLTDSNAQLLKDLILNGIYGMVKSDKKRPIVSEQNAHDFRVLAIEIINVLNDIDIHYKHSPVAQRGNDEFIHDELEEIQRKVTKLWRLLL